MISQSLLGEVRRDMASDKGPCSPQFLDCGEIKIVVGAVPNAKEVYCMYIVVARLISLARSVGVMENKGFALFGYLEQCKM